MLVKSYELENAVLVWAVAQAEGLLVDNKVPAGYDPVNDNAQAAFFIDKYKAELMPVDSGLTYKGTINGDGNNYVNGDNWRICICRAVVTVLLGQDINVPDSLLN